MISKIPNDAFTSAILKVEWAKQHIGNMEKLLSAIHEARPRTVFANDCEEPDRVQLALDMAPLLTYCRNLQMMAGDAIHNLRSALDHLAWGVVATFKEPSSHLYFPISDRLESLVGSESFREIKGVAPDIADVILSDIKPYGAGNAFLKLNHLDRADKHRLVVTHSVATQCMVYMATDDDEPIPEVRTNCFILIANPTRVPRPGTVAALHNENYRGATFDIRFQAGLSFENEPVIPTLHQLAELVTGAVKALLAHIHAKKHAA